MDYNIENVRYVAHEIKNQLSVCDLYTEILSRYCQKNGIEDDTVLNSVECIKRAINLAGASLLDLKSFNTQDIKTHSIKQILEEAYNISKVYTISHNIEFYYEPESDYKIDIDKNKLLGVIVNLVKNASEAFKDNSKTNYIRISYKKIDSLISIIVSNNAPPVEIDNLFDDGVTTKSTGSGVGLYISRKNMEDMGGTLKLLKSDSTSTEFEIQISCSKN